MCFSPLSASLRVESASLRLKGEAVNPAHDDELAVRAGGGSAAEATATAQLATLKRSQLPLDERVNLDGAAHASGRFS